MRRVGFTSDEKGGEEGWGGRSEKTREPLPPIWRQCWKLWTGAVLTTVWKSMADFFKPKPPPPPSNLRIVKTKANEIELEWEPPPRPSHLQPNDMYIHGYEISYQVEDAQPKRRLLDGMWTPLALELRERYHTQCHCCTLVFSGFTTRFLIRGLGPGMMVKDISVKARSEGGWGVQSLPPIAGRSSSAPPGQVEWIEVTEVEAFSAALTWSKPRIDNGAVIANYKVQAYQPGVPGSAIEMETKSSNTSYVVWALKPYSAMLKPTE